MKVAKTLIPVNKLINYRKAYGRKLQKAGKNNFNAPAWVKEDFQDENTVNKFLQSEPLIQITGNGAEFASKTLISPKYISVLKGLAKASKTNRERLQKYNERIERAKFQPVRTAEPFLGNTGSNLENFEKKTREKRYAIQNFIQKNRLPGKRKCDCGANHKTVYDCEKCRRPGNTVCTCGQPVSDYIPLKRNNEHGSISAGGVATCGSVWACPVCRSKIVQKRSEQLDEIYKNGTEKGYKFALVTFTIPHTGADNLVELYGSSTLSKGISGAFTKWRSSYCYSKKFKAENEFIGDIKAVEITWGQVNGFHPHIHFVVITKNEIDPQKWQSEFLKEWQKQCSKSGLKIPNEKGVKVDLVNNGAMVNYLAKWSVGSELQSDSVKESKGVNYSIAQLELMLIDEKYRCSGMRPMSLDRISGILASYYKAMHGQKQLQYGNLQTGWKDELIGEDVEDSQITQEQSEHTHTDILVLKKSLYMKINSQNKLSEFIECLESMESVPGYKNLIYEKARTLLYKMGFDESGMLKPCETIQSEKIPSVRYRNGKPQKI